MPAKTRCCTLTELQSIHAMYYQLNAPYWHGSVVQSYLLLDRDPDISKNTRFNFYFTRKISLWLMRLQSFYCKFLKLNTFCFHLNIFIYMYFKLFSHNVGIIYMITCSTNYFLLLSTLISVLCSLLSIFICSISF